MQLDVTLPHMPCSWITLDAMDVSGELHLDVVRALGWEGDPVVPAGTCRLGGRTCRRAGGDWPAGRWAWAD